jgi:hypothetical protein
MVAMVYLPLGRVLGHVGDLGEFAPAGQRFLLDPAAGARMDPNAPVAGRERTMLPRNAPGPHRASWPQPAGRR